MRTLRIRPAVVADARCLSDQFLRARSAAMPWLAVVHTPGETYRWFSQLIGSSEVWVAQSERILGFAARQGDWLEHLYVDRSAQGRGVGRALLDQVKARSDGHLQLHVFTRNVDACRFYEAAGFVVTGTSDGSDNEEREPATTYAWYRPAQADQDGGGQDTADVSSAVAQSARSVPV